MELTWNGQEPLTLDDGSTRTFLQDGDTVTVTGWAPGPDGSPIGLGEVVGTIAPAWHNEDTPAARSARS